ncbi:MAG: hypothetical protein AAF696_09700 [Bacteroidota bacterium]
MIKNLPFPSFLLSFLLILATFGQSIAQNQRWQFDLNMSYARPISEFRSDGYKDGIGMGLGIYSSPIQADNALVAMRLGARFDYDFAGKSAETMLAPIPETNLFGEMRLQNSSLGMHALIRMESPMDFPVQLYVEGLIGSRALATSEVFNDHDDWDDDQCIDFTIERNWNLSYGAAVGTLIHLGPRTRLNLRASYMNSTPSSFVDLATARQVEDNLYSYGMQNAPATVVRFEAGFNFDLDMECTPSRSEVNRGNSFSGDPLN